MAVEEWDRRGVMALILAMGTKAVDLVPMGKAIAAPMESGCEMEIALVQREELEASIAPNSMGPTRYSSSSTMMATERSRKKKLPSA